MSASSLSRIWHAPNHRTRPASRVRPRCSPVYQHTLCRRVQDHPSKPSPPILHTQLTCNLHSLAESASEPSPVPAHAPQNLVVVPTPQTFEPRSPRLVWQQTCQSPPIPLSLVFAHVPRSRLPFLAQVSKRFNAAPQLALYRTLELSTDDSDACIAQLAIAPHLAELVTKLEMRAYPQSHWASFELALALALQSMRALSALTLPAFNAELLSAAPGAITRLTLLAGTASFDDYLAAHARARLTTPFCWRAPCCARGVIYNRTAPFCARWQLWSCCRPSPGRPLHDTANCKYAVRRPRIRSALQRARWCTKGTCASPRTRCRCADPRAVTGRSRKHSYGARGTRNEARVHIRRGTRLFPLPYHFDVVPD